MVWRGAAGHEQETEASDSLFLEFVRNGNVMHCSTPATVIIVSNSSAVRLTFILTCFAVLRLQSQTIKIRFLAEETFFFLMKIQGGISFPEFVEQIKKFPVWIKHLPIKLCFLVILTSSRILFFPRELNLITQELQNFVHFIFIHFSMMKNVRTPRELYGIQPTSSYCKGR
jgi:hypothetical protein